MSIITAPGNSIETSRRGLKRPMNDSRLTNGIGLTKGTDNEPKECTDRVPSNGDLRCHGRVTGSHFRRRRESGPTDISSRRVYCGGDSRRHGTPLVSYPAIRTKVAAGLVMVTARPAIRNGDVRVVPAERVSPARRTSTDYTCFAAASTQF